MAKGLSPKEMFEAYKTWVCNNPNVVTDVETVLTWSSYFIAGKVNKSPVVSELVYSISKLYSLFNDRLIKQAYGREPSRYETKDKIKLMLTVTHYCEVFIELVLKQRFGSRGKWSVATILQLIKCSSALVLLYQYKELPVAHPPIPVLQRRKIAEESVNDENSNSFTLKRSGRVVRRVEGAPPIAFRDWQPVKNNDLPVTNADIKYLTYAETIHIIKPLVHLAAMRTFGTNTWKQWFISLGLDLASLKLFKKHIDELSPEDKIEVNRRKLSLLLYLLRSPMYDNHTRSMIESTLTTMSNKIPLAGIVCNPVIQYLSYWQDIYFYMWSS